MTWKDAHSYCRQYYKDLVIIQNQTDNNQLTVMMTPNKYAWIGLFRDAWKWSLSPLPSLPVSTSFITWMKGQPDMLGLQRPCSASDPSGSINDQLCSNVLPFLCMDRRTKQQIVRLKVKSSQNLNDPAVMETILQWIKQNLKEHGIEEDIVRVAWNIHPDGNVFSND
ncbi:hepatic lectin-like [Carassius auratus]|uniref:Hepatic lectin-like n=1 Tax=Carassius auratus TaxID=7957 RepID=A0A6P6JZT8_CARAU|nr:hepatic lectin-like [Carassius auratus]